jgi:hypothetical protein
VANVLVPLATVALLVALGVGLRRLLPSAQLWRGFERLTYFVFFPALLVHALSGTELTLAGSWRLIAAVNGAILLAAALTVALRRHIPASDREFSSVFQASTRFNTYIILSLAGGLFGNAGLAAASIALAAMIILSNLLSVCALLVWGDARDDVAGARGTARSLASNPLILACLLGLALNASGLALPGMLEDTIALLGKPALAIGLLCVGAALTGAALRRNLPLVATASSIKLLFQPAAVVAFASLLGVTGVSFVVALICAGAPVAPSSAILARQFGGDVALMAGLVTATTCLSALSLSLLLTLATTLGG